jgi:hypothetical protein
LPDQLSYAQWGGTTSFGGCDTPTSQWNTKV